MCAAAPLERAQYDALMDAYNSIACPPTTCVRFGVADECVGGNGTLPVVSCNGGNVVRMYAKNGCQMPRSDCDAQTHPRAAHNGQLADAIAQDDRSYGHVRSADFLASIAPPLQYFERFKIPRQQSAGWNGTASMDCPYKLANNVMLCQDSKTQLVVIESCSSLANNKLNGTLPSQWQSLHNLWQL